MTFVISWRPHVSIGGVVYISICVLLLLQTVFMTLLCVLSADRNATGITGVSYIGFGWIGFYV